MLEMRRNIVASVGASEAVRAMEIVKKNGTIVSERYEEIGITFTL